MEKHGEVVGAFTYCIGCFNGKYCNNIKFKKCERLKHLIDTAKKAGLKCDCGYELLVYMDKVFCPNDQCKNSDGDFKQKKPGGMI